jgi:hypothetical protein
MKDRQTLTGLDLLYQYIPYALFFSLKFLSIQNHLDTLYFTIQLEIQPNANECEQIPRRKEPKNTSS